MPISARDGAPAGRQDRRRVVEAALAGFAAGGSPRRMPPPDGRLGVGDFPIGQLRLTLISLGPVFAGFGRYLSTRPDLLRRRHCTELALIADAGLPADPAAIDAHLHRQLGAPPSRRFFQFDTAARGVTLWTERHDAWVAPGVPATVTIVRPDAAEWLDRDLPLLSLLQPCLGVGVRAFADAAADYADTLRRRLDQTVQATALGRLAGDAAAANGFATPVCYHDHCAPGVLTTARCDGPTVAELSARGGLAEPAARAALGRRVAVAWLSQAVGGPLLPFDFEADRLVVSGDGLVLTGAVCELNGPAERIAFSRYVEAAAADHPDSAAAWIIDSAGAEMPPELEESLRRRFRQAVPFRDGEWSGDDRLAEYLLVQWRAAREADWPLSPHCLHVYRGIVAVARITNALAPDEDALLGAFQDVRLRRGLAEAAGALAPSGINERLDAAMRELINLPQKLDEVLTLAAEGRLRVKLHVPASRETRHVKQHTALLVASLVLVAATFSLVRHLAPSFGPAAERLGFVLLLVLGGWLLVAAARF